jgi:FixJ family two-component response regulator
MSGISGCTNNMVLQALHRAGAPQPRFPLQASPVLRQWDREQKNQARPLVRLVDPDAELRRRLTALLSSAGLDTQAYEDFDGCLKSSGTGIPGCLVVDAQLPPITGPGLQERLKPLRLRLPIVILSARSDVSAAVDAMKAGVADFLLKPVDEQEVVAAVRAAVQADAERRVAEARVADLRAAFGKLTRREREVFALVTAGRLNKQVAGDLGICEITVKVHRGAVMRKMGARTLVDLVRMADALADMAGSPEEGQPRPRSEAGTEHQLKSPPARIAV